MKWIGLTGGIATGKSTVTKILLQNKIPVIDADQISHQLTEVGQSGYQQIISHFGETILDANRKIDRAKLGQIIFNDSEKKMLLESLLHPLIQQQVIQQRQKLKEQGRKISFYDVPLLFEKRMQNNFDRTVLVWCDFKTQISRLMSRNNLSHQQAMSRIQSQLPLNEKLPLANFCLDNSTTQSSLEIQIKHLLNVSL